MANSKSDGKTPKTMDIMQPGKTAPPTTARPVIVSNRPILRQDPMMVSPDGMEKPELQTRPTVSRVGKTLTVLAPHQSKIAKAPTITPLSGSSQTHAATAPSASASEKSVSASMPQGRTPEEIATKKAIAVKTDDVPSENGVAAAPSPDQTSTSVVPQSEPVAEASKPAESPAPAAEAPEAKPDLPPSSVMPQVAQDPPIAAPDTALSTEDSSTDTDTSATSSGVTNDEDGQLAPNKTIDEAKKKADDIEAARLAEQEQIIASRRYYLPITNTDGRRGLTLSLIVLLLVLLLAAVWFDIALDAGIVHVGGLQPLTHFFR